jgi:serine protease Do
MTVITKYASILALALSAGLAVPQAVAQNQPVQPAPQLQQSPEAQAPTGQFVDLAPRLIETVVNITAEVSEPAPNGEAGRSPLPPGSPFEDFFRDFFGDEDRGGGGGGIEPPQQRGSAVGSGFIINPEGYIVTNNHVVENATSVTVTLHDESEYEAKIVGRDPRTDLALLKIDAPNDLPFAQWGDSTKARIAEPVLAIGNPFGLGGSATWGIISALARDLGIGPYDEFLQTDASINRGNSGGPVFNARGEVIGVATAIFSPSGGNIGLGFATPSAIAQSVVEDLRESGEVKRGWIGVAIQPVTEELASGLGLEEARGVVVADVTEGSPADKAGIEIGDVMLEFADRKITEQVRLPRLVADTEIGSTVPVTVWREGNEETLEITVGDLSKAAGTDQPEAEEPDSEGTDAQGGLGLQLSPIEPGMRDRLGLQGDETGVLVAGVEPDSVAAERGLRSGDVILRVGRQEVAAPDEVVQAVKDAQERGDETVLLLIQREQASRYVALPLSAG